MIEQMVRDAKQMLVSRLLSTGGNQWESTTAMPEPETLDVFEKQFDKHRETVRDLKREQKDLQRDLNQAEK